MIERNEVKKNLPKILVVNGLVWKTPLLILEIVSDGAMTHLTSHQDRFVLEIESFDKNKLSISSNIIMSCMFGTIWSTMDKKKSVNN